MAIKIGAWSIGLFVLSLFSLIIGGLLWSTANNKAEGESKQPSLGIGIFMTILGIAMMIGAVAALFGVGARARSQFRSPVGYY